MAFNPIGITTDANGTRWRPWPQKAEPEPAPPLVNACCESQLVLIKWNLEKLSKKPMNEFLGSGDAFNEYKMWIDMLAPISEAIHMDVPSGNNRNLQKISYEISRITLEMYNKQVEWRSIQTATEIDLIVCRNDGTEITHKISLDEQNSMFDQMTTFFEFEKWGTVVLCGQKTNVGLKQSTREDTKQSIDGYGRDQIHMQHRKGELLHFDIQESLPTKKYIKKLPAVVEEDEQIELRVFQAPIPGYDDTHSPREIRKLTIQKLMNSNSMFTQIGAIVPYDDWGVVKLTNGIDKAIILYEEKSTAMHITMEPSFGVRKNTFDSKFLTLLTGKIRGMEMFKRGWTGNQVRLEITKRYMSDTQDAVVQSNAALAEALAARFQSITWV
jgi:hypothetical protein